MEESQQKDEYFMAEGHVGKVEYPLNEAMLEYAVKLFGQIHESYLTENAGNLYFAIVPDKNYYLAEKNGQSAMDYEVLMEYMRQHLEYMRHIDITELLSAQDYYYTDIHWRQEQLLDVAAYLAAAMGAELSAVYEEKVLEVPFYGTYFEYANPPLEPDEIRYLTNEMLKNCIVTGREGEPLQLYDKEKARGADAYEMFLAGNQPIVTIQNPQAGTEKELILFRDSFGSSLAPLLAEQYQTITLIDVRFVRSYMLEEYVEFHGQDVLFLYSTLLLNSSLAMR